MIDENPKLFFSFFFVFCPLVKGTSSNVSSLARASFQKNKNSTHHVWHVEEREREREREHEVLRAKEVIYSRGDR